MAARPLARLKYGWADGRGAGPADLWAWIFAAATPDWKYLLGAHVGFDHGDPMEKIGWFSIADIERIHSEDETFATDLLGDRDAVLRLVPDSGEISDDRLDHAFSRMTDASIICVRTLEMAKAGA